MEDDLQETANVERYDDNPNNNLTRMTTKESCISEADLNLNNSNRPITIANSQNHLIMHKRPTTVVNRRPEKIKIYIKQRKLYLEDKLTVNRSEGQVIIYIVIFSDSVTNFSRHHINIFNQKIKDRRARFNIFQVHYHGKSNTRII